MTTRLNKTVIAKLLGPLLLLYGALPIHAPAQNQLPDIGTTAGATLSIDQELAMGDFYVRQMRASVPLIHDPLLTRYINQLGNRLVTHAHSVRTPFHFHLVQNSQINAFAFFGGNVVLNSALFHYTENESQLASVLAHEISHVTQRHLARAMEEQQHNTPLVWAGALGSLLLAMAAPQAGMAALSSTLAGSQQGIINFTQLNEQEADRIGLQVLQRAGFDPQAMFDFMQKLADKSLHTSTLPEILLTHPLPTSRLSDIRNRANQMTSPPVSPSQDYLFAKVRILGMYSTGESRLDSDLLPLYRHGNAQEQLAAQYGQAILLWQAKKYDDARNTLQPLLMQHPSNLWFLDLMTDIDLAQKRASQAITRLHKLPAIQHNEPTLQLNQANAYIEGNQPLLATKLLYPYTYNHPDDPNGWQLLTQATAALGKQDEELAARAENAALNGQFDQAISLLSNASSLVKLGSLKQARYDARIDQLRQLNQRYRPYQRR